MFRYLTGIISWIFQFLFIFLCVATVKSGCRVIENVENGIQSEVTLTKVETFSMGATLDDRLLPMGENTDSLKRDYINRYLTIALEEQEEHQIPASITLAQGLLESRFGTSKLAIQNNNHFGIKCFLRSCKKGHCTNFTDDTHKDFFRKFKRVEDSYHAHSALLKKPLYKRLFQSKNYKDWAHGLQACGYATDPHYAEKLINTIETYRLHQYDK